MDLGVGLDVDVDQGVAGAGAGRPQLLPVDAPALAIAPRGAAHGAGVRAGVGLRHRHAHADVTGDELRQIALALLRRSVAQQVQAAEHARSVGGEEIEALARELLGDDRHVENAAAEPAMLLRERHADEAHLDPGPVQLVRIGCFAVEAAHVVRRRQPIHHAADRLGQHSLLAAELEIHGDTDQVCILMTPWAASPASSSSERPSPESTSRVCSPSVGGGRKSISRPPSQRIGRCTERTVPAVGWGRS